MRQAVFVNGISCVYPPAAILTGKVRLAYVSASYHIDGSDRMAANTARNRRSTSRSGSSSIRTKSGRGSQAGRPVRKAQSKRPAGKSSAKKTAARRRTAYEDTYAEPVKEDIILIAVLAVSALLLLGVFGLGGRAGDLAASFLFGIFGSLAYAFPFLLFLGTAFCLSNRGSRLARIKLIAAFFFIWSLCALICVDTLPGDPAGNILQGYRISASSRSGGGLLGYIPAYPLYKAFGRVGAVLIFVCALMIFGVLVTGKRIFARIWYGIRTGMENLSGHLEEARQERQARMEERLLYEEEEAQEDIDAGDSFSEDDDIDEEAEPAASSRPKKNAGRFSLGIFSRGADDSIDEEEFMDEEEEGGDEPKEKVPAVQAVSADHAAPDRERKQPAASADKLIKPAPKRPSPSITLRQREPSSENLHVPEFLRGGRMHDSQLERSVKTSVEEENAQTAADIDAVVSRSMEKAEKEKYRFTPTVKAAQGVQAAGKDQQSQQAPSETASPDPADAKAPAGQEDSQDKKYIFPPLDLLESSGGQSSVETDSLRQTAAKLQETFDSFGVGASVVDVSCGPAVTRYEVQPDTGVKVSKIVSLADDIKLNLAVTDIRIEAPIPGKAAVGIEVPNSKKEMVCLRDLLASPEAKSMKSKVAFAVGKDIGGQVVMANIDKMPHLLIAGATGSGKSVCINTIIMSILYRADPSEVRMIMIDPKVVELTMYNGLPHLLIPVVTDPKKAAGALNWVVQTMMERYHSFSQAGVKDIKGYNAKVKNIQAQGLDTEEFQYMPRILVIIDELADLMMVAQSEVESSIVRLCQLARAAGIHLVIATQRPSVNVITGLIKANVPSRIAFAVSSGVDSRTIIDTNGAEKLLGNGDMLFAPQGSKPLRVQGAFVSESEIKKVTDFVKEQYAEPIGYDESITQNIEQKSADLVLTGVSGNDNEHDLYFEDAGRFIIEKEKASIGMLQRVFKIGFNRAARIMDQLADAGVVGPELGTKPRQILMSKEEFEQYLADHK